MFMTTIIKFPLMRRRVKILLWTPILLFFIGSGLIFLIFSTSFWKKPIISIVNNRLLKKHELYLKVRRIEGNIFSNLELIDAELCTIRKNSIIKFEHIKVSYKLNTLLSPQPELLGMEIDGGEFSFPQSIDTLQHLFSGDKKKKKPKLKTTTSVTEPTSWMFDFGVTNFTYYHNNEPYFIEILFGDLCTVEDRLEINLDTANFYIKNNIDVFTLSKTKLNNDNNGFSIEHLALKNYDADLMANLHFSKDMCGSINISANNIRPVNYLPKLKKEFGKEDSINIECQIEINDSVRIFADFFGQLRDNPIENGNIIASVFENNLNISKFYFSSEEEYINIDFKSASSKKHTANLEIGKINLDRWNVATTKTSLTGKSHFNISGKLENPKSIIAAIDFSDIGVDTLNLSKVKGKLIFSDQILTIQDKIVAKLEENNFTLSGNTNFKTKTLNIDCKVNAPDISIFSPLLSKLFLTPGAIYCVTLA